MSRLRRGGETFDTRAAGLTIEKMGKEVKDNNECGLFSTEDADVFPEFPVATEP